MTNDVSQSDRHEIDQKPFSRFKGTYLGFIAGVVFGLLFLVLFNGIFKSQIGAVIFLGAFSVTCGALGYLFPQYTKNWAWAAGEILSNLS